MRRGLLKELANTPVDIACGWRLHSDLAVLRRLSGSVITIDLLNAKTSVEGSDVVPPPYISSTVSEWTNERLHRNAVPIGLVTAAHLTLSPVDIPGGLRITCSTLIQTSQGNYTNEGVTRWRDDDIGG